MRTLMIALPLMLTVVEAFTVCGARVSAPSRACATRMFEVPEEKKVVDPTALDALAQVTRSREAGKGRTGSIVVTDGSGSFFKSRTIFNSLYDFGGFASITASSADVVDAKKMLISRASRYSGLLDVLTFHEGEVAEAFAGQDTWLAINPDESTLLSKVDAASAAGVSKIFLLLSELPADPEALEAKLQASSAEYSVMRTGSLVDTVPEGAALKLGEIDMPVCEDVGKEDVFRFVTEALTLPEAAGRSFSLCPTVNEGVTSTLKQMRLCGYERRDEIKLLLSGAVRESFAPEAVTEEEAQEQEELVLRSQAEIAAEREEELKMLLARAKQRGIETQQRLEKEEKEKAEKRKEMAEYYKSPDVGPRGAADASTDDKDEKPADETDEKPKTDGDEPPLEPA